MRTKPAPDVFYDPDIKNTARLNQFGNRVLHIAHVTHENKTSLMEWF